MSTTKSTTPSKMIEKLEECRAINEKLKQEINQKNTLIMNLEKSQNVNIIDQNSQFEKEKKLNLELANLQESISKKDALISKAETEVTTLKVRIDAVQADLSRLTKENSELLAKQDSSSKKDNVVSQFEAEISTLKTRIEASEAQVVRLTKANSELLANQESSSKKDNVASQLTLKNQIEASEAQVVRLTKENLELTLELQNQKSFSNHAADSQKQKEKELTLELVKKNDEIAAYLQV